MYLPFDDPGISKALIISGTREEQLQYILRQELEEGMVILDLGANIGFYVLLEAQIVGSKGKVYAVEPSPRNFELLNRNIELNGVKDIVETFNIGASNQKGKEKFYLSPCSNLSTFIPRSYRSAGRTEPINSKCLEVEVTDLSSFVKDKRTVDFMRMDIEGYEVEVFEGMQEALKKGNFSPKIVFECHFPKYDDKLHSMRRQLEKLFEFGYKAKTMTSNDEERSTFRTKGYSPQTLIRTGDFKYQGIYYNVSKPDALELICDLGGVRDVLLVKD